MHSGRSFSVAAWTLIAACSGGRDETPGAESGGSGPRREAPTPAASDPARSPSSSRGTVPMKVSVKVDGKSYRSSGMGECASSADASIYQVPATLWHAIYAGDGSELRNLNLTIWRPKAGRGDMVGLSLEIGETTHQIATVKGGQTAGSGVPGVRPAGKGGTLTVAGKDDHGDAIELSVECERFDEVVAEGG